MTRRRPARKGQLIQIAFFLVGIIIIAITALIATKIQSKTMDAIQGSEFSNAETTDLAVKAATFAGITDYGIIVVIVLLTAVLLFTSWLIPSHPFFVVVNVIGIFFLVLLSMLLSNLYGQMVQGDDAAFSAEAADYPKTTFAVQWLPYICIIVTFLSTIIMFSKANDQGGYG